MTRNLSLGGDLIELVSVGTQQPGAMAVAERGSLALDVARGAVSGVKSVNKFGKAPSGIQTTATDVWSRADATPTQQIWLAPKTAIPHIIASSSAADTAGSTGAGTVIYWGLRDWNTAETSGTMALGGTTPAYAIIHRIKALGQATTTSIGVNAGTITATTTGQAGGETVTAVILPNEGQTEMAIYGVPSTQDFYMTRWACAMAKEVTTQAVQFALRVNENPDVQTLGYTLKNDMYVVSSGASSANFDFVNPPKYSGPCIIKVQGVASTADVDAKAAFDGYLVTK